MARVNLHVPDELLDAVRDEYPGVNLSALLQERLRAELGCQHEHLCCADCHEDVDRAAVMTAAASEFFREAMWAVGELAHRGGTAEGAARVMRNVALEVGIAAASTAVLPRPTRTEREQRRWNERKRATA